MVRGLVASDSILIHRNRPTRRCAQTVWSAGIALLTTRFHMLARTVSPADPRRQSFRSRGSSDVQSKAIITPLAFLDKQQRSENGHAVYSICSACPYRPTNRVLFDSVGRIVRTVTPHQQAHNQQLRFGLSLQSYASCSQAHPINI